jgi:hypothetical protein
VLAFSAALLLHPVLQRACFGVFCHWLGAWSVFLLCAQSGLLIDDHDPLGLMGGDVYAPDFRRGGARNMEVHCVFFDAHRWWCGHRQHATHCNVRMFVQLMG